MRFRFSLPPKRDRSSQVKNYIKNIYLSFRKYFFRFLAILISQNRSRYAISSPEVNKILFIRIDRVGDLVLSTPAIKALKEKYPHSKLIVLASRSNYSLLENNPYVDQTLIYDAKQSLLMKLKSIKHLRTFGFDMAVDPYVDYELKTALIAFLSGATKRIGYASHGREILFNLPAPEIDENEHFADLTLGVLKPLGIIPKERNPEIFLAEDEKKWASNWLSKRKLDSRPVVGIHPGAYYESQRWPPDHFSELIRELGKAETRELILFGGPGDEMLLDSIVSSIGSDIRTYIPDDLRKFAALLSCCSVFICNNSGPLHIAVAVNTPTISLMGPTRKDRWMPIGSIHRVLRIDDLPCIGCGLGYCKIKTHDCMRLITAEMVMDVIDEVVSN